MAALFMPPGPIDLFAFFRDDFAMYIGTCKEAPEVDVRPAYIDIKNDIGGRSVPIQKMYDGEQHLLYLTATNRFDWAGYKFMSRASVPGDVGPGVSIDGALNRGSLSLGLDDFEFVLRYSFGGTPNNTVAFPVGRRYYSCTLLGARESTVGSRLMEVSMVLEANGLFVPASRSFRLYTELEADVLAGLPALS